MTDDPTHGSEHMAPGDLDALIGNLEAEAARRRAEPGFPVDAEARLSLELERHASSPGGARSVGELLRAVADAVSRVGSSAPDTGASRRGRRQPDTGELLSSLAVAMGAAVLGLAREIDRLELQVRRLEETRRQGSDDDGA